MLVERSLLKKASREPLKLAYSLRGTPPAKLLSIGSAVISRKFSIKCEHFIGFEASILPLCASTTVSIVSSKLRKPITSDWFSKIYYGGV